MSDDFLYRFCTPVSSCQGSVVTHLLHVIPHGHHSLFSVMCSRSQYQKVYQCMGILLCMRIHGVTPFVADFLCIHFFCTSPLQYFQQQFCLFLCFKMQEGGQLQHCNFQRSLILKPWCNLASSSNRDVQQLSGKEWSARLSLKLFRNFN